MTRAPAEWNVVAVGPPGQTYWRRLDGGSEGDMLALFKARQADYQEAGGLKLLDAEGRMTRWTGPKADPRNGGK